MAVFSDFDLQHDDNHHRYEREDRYFPEIGTFLQARQAQRPDDMGDHRKQQHQGNYFGHPLPTYPMSRTILPICSPSSIRL